MDTNIKKDVRLNNVFDDSTFMYVYRKSEKIGAALYLVTSLVSDIEPLKSSIRTSSLQLIKDIRSAGDGQVSDTSAAARKIALSVTELTSYVDIALVAKVMSAMNHSIIKRELMSLMSILQEKYETDERRVLFDPSYFSIESSQQDISQIVRRLTESDSRTVGIDSTFVRPTVPGALRQTKVAMSYMTPSAEKVQKENGESLKKTMPATKSVMPINKNDRRQTILAIIKDKKQVRIKDITNLMTDCGEKTIQRELLAMVADGLLHKEGERRWSTYSLA